MKEGEGCRGSSVCVTLRYRNIDLTDLLVVVGIPSSERSGISALRGELGARRNLWIVCVAPLRLGGLRWGLRWKKSNPSVGWEVPVKSQRLKSESCMERADDTRSRQTCNRTLLH
jgi:hypothetical protein